MPERSIRRHFKQSLVFRLPRFAGKGRFDAPFIRIAIVVGRLERLPHVASPYDYCGPVVDDNCCGYPGGGPAMGPNQAAPYYENSPAMEGTPGRRHRDRRSFRCRAATAESCRQRRASDNVDPVDITLIASR